MLIEQYLLLEIPSQQHKSPELYTVGRNYLLFRVKKFFTILVSADHHHVVNNSNLNTMCANVFELAYFFIMKTFLTCRFFGRSAKKRKPPYYIKDLLTNRH